MPRSTPLPWRSIRDRAILVTFLDTGLRASELAGIKLTDLNLRDGFVKVLAHQETGEILGCHIIGSEASILIQEVVNAIRMRLTTDAITESIYVHPALPEVVQRAFASLGL